MLIVDDADGNSMPPQAANDAQTMVIAADDDCAYAYVSLAVEDKVTSLCGA
jgi:hypothetical protein